MGLQSGEEHLKMLAETMPWWCTIIEADEVKYFRVLRKSPLSEVLAALKDLTKERNDAENAGRCS
jgi:hypothetical protein